MINLQRISQYAVVRHIQRTNLNVLLVASLGEGEDKVLDTSAQDDNVQAIEGLGALSKGHHALERLMINRPDLHIAIRRLFEDLLLCSLAFRDRTHPKNDSGQTMAGHFLRSF